MDMVDARAWHHLASLLIALVVGCTGPVAGSSAPSGSAPGSQPPTSAGAPQVPSTSAAGASAAPARVELEMPFAGRGVAGLAHYLAVEEGLYAAEGLDVSSAAVGATTVLASSLQSGGIQLAGSLPLENIGAVVANGGDLVAVAAGLHLFAAGLVGRPGITSANDLKGQEVGVTGTVGPTASAAWYWLRDQGLDPERDVAFVSAGGVAETRAALDAGTIAAAALTPPISYATVRAGYVELADLSRLDTPYSQGALATTRRYLREQPDVVRRAIRGYSRGMRLVLDDQATATRVLAKWTNIDQPDDLERTYELARRGFAPGPVLPRAAAQTVTDQLAVRTTAARGLAPDQLFDNSLAEQVARELGF